MIISLYTYLAPPQKILMRSIFFRQVEISEEESAEDEEECATVNEQRLENFIQVCSIGSLVWW